MFKKEKCYQFLCNYLSQGATGEWLKSRMWLRSLRLQTPALDPFCPISPLLYSIIPNMQDLVNEFGPNEVIYCFLFQF